MNNPASTLADTDGDWADDDWLVLDGGLDQKLSALHREMLACPSLDGVERISVATYDARTDLVRTLAQSNRDAAPFERYAVRLADAPGLHNLAATGRPIVAAVTDDSIERIRPPRLLARDGYLSRYAVRLHRRDTLFGFLFFNSRQPGYFSATVIDRLRPYRRLIDMLVVGELSSVQLMLAAVHTAREIGRIRDEETGAHLDRMAHYAQLVGQRLAARLNLSDEYVEYLFRYAPLHDIGKVGIPDHILLKPGKLTADEYTTMKAHVGEGLRIIEAMMRDHGLAGLPYASVLRNIVGCHHERWDGAGYPNGLAGAGIPLEGRIVAVADVFDALTSGRPYKKAWTFDAAAAFLQAQAGRHFDPDCVEALLADRQALEAIQLRFFDEPSA
jgi:Response regulator containing a CheY-like receiver domain and an HD-GYP domain